MEPAIHMLSLAGHQSIDGTENSETPFARAVGKTPSLLFIIDCSFGGVEQLTRKDLFSDSLGWIMQTMS